MTSTLLLPDPVGLALMKGEVQKETRMITATACTTAKAATCPVCSSPATRVHSKDTRTLADLPCSGQCVRFRLQVRRFWCMNPSCSRLLFAERLPACAPAFARRTIQQTALLSEIAFALGGRAGARIASLLQMGASHDTLGRLMRRSAPPEVPTPQVVGLDDFAWKKGDRYGTVIIDQLTHRVVDILPDREADTVAQWFASHPGVQAVCRDRAGAYADGVRKGAPQARQIADRFHLLVNLKDAMVRLFERKHETLTKVLAQAATQQADAACSCTAPDTAGKDVLNPLTTTEAQRQARQTRRRQRYEEVIRMHQQGMSQVAIATLTGLHRETVRRYLQTPTFVPQVRPNRQSRKLDPYKAYLHQRWVDGQQNVAALLAEIRAQGFHGSDTIVYDYLRTKRVEPEWMEAYRQRKQQLGRFVSTKPLSAKQAAWLFVCNPRRLKWRQIWWQVEPLRAGDEELERAYLLAQDFRTMIVQRQACVLARWCREAQESGIPEVRSLAAGIYRDYDAVYGALETAYSNGQTEAQVHRLKLIKRQAYGRASFEVFRLRALHGSGVTYAEQLQVEHASHRECV